MQTFLLCLRTPAIRAAMFGLFLLGFTFASTKPYQSLLAIDEFAMSERSFSALMFGSAILSVLFSVALGNLADILNNRRTLALISATAGIIGFGSVYLVPNVLMFALSTLLIIPLSNSLYSTLFAGVRSVTNDMAKGEAAAVNSTVRSVFAASWILIPGAVSFALVNSESLTPSYLFACIASVAIFALIYWTFPSDTAQTKGNQSKKFSFFASLSDAMNPKVALGIVLVALQMSSHNLHAVLMPLILTKVAAGKITDVGLIAGSVAALEIPFMLAFGWAMRHFSTSKVLACGTAIFAVYMLLLSLASEPWQFYALMPVNAAGAAAILSIPMSYLQNLMPEKPGLGTSLLSISGAIGGGISAIAFAIGTSTMGYSGTALIGGALALLSSAAIWLQDRE